MGKDCAFFGEERSAVGAHLLAGGDIFVVHATGLGDDGGLDFGDGGVFGDEFNVETADLFDAPEEVDGGGAGLGEGLRDEGDLFGEGREGGRGTAVDADGHAHGGRDADRWGSPDDHVADDGGDLLVVGGEDVGLLEGELGLIEEVNAGREPFEGRNHVPSSLDDLGRYGGEYGGRRLLAGRRNAGSSRYNARGGERGG